MIKVSTADPVFKEAYRNARRVLPVEELESPRQYGARWREVYRCRVEARSSDWPYTTYVFDNDADYTWFMLQWG